MALILHGTRLSSAEGDEVSKRVAVAQAGILEEQHEASAVLPQTRNDMLPVNRLPDECLSMIFLLAHGSETNLSVYLTQKALDRLPLALSRVSHRWRVIVLSLPRLWSRIVVQLPYSCARSPPSDSEKIKRLSAMQERLKRTKDLPFDVAIRIEDPFAPGSLNNRNVLRSRLSFDIHFISPYFPRFRALDIVTKANDDSFTTLCGQILVRMPWLERYSATNLTSSTQIAVPLPFPGQAFRELSLRNVRAHSFTHSFLNCLTVFRVERSAVCVLAQPIDPSDADLEYIRTAWPQVAAMNRPLCLMSLDAIQAARNLRVLDLRELCLKSFGQPKSADLPNLHTVYLSLGYTRGPNEESVDGEAVNGVSSTIAFFQHITTPALRTCVLSGRASYPRLTMDGMLESLARAAPPLFELVLDHVSVSFSHTIARLLSLLPRLRALTFSRTTLHVLTIDALGAKSPLTDLRSLSIFHTPPAGPERDSRYMPNQLCTVLRTRFESETLTSIEKLTMKGHDVSRLTQVMRIGLRRWVRKVQLLA